MPPPPHLQKTYPGKTHLLKHAAEWGQTITVKCNLCRRTGVFLATDLIGLLDPERPALAPPFNCPRCRTDEFMRVTLNSPTAPISAACSSAAPAPSAASRPGAR